jgi:hypothetical protein
VIKTGHDVGNVMNGTQQKTVKMNFLLIFSSLFIHVHASVVSSRTSHGLWKNIWCEQAT